MTRGAVTVAVGVPGATIAVVGVVNVVVVNVMAIG
jgi:hypothetical protein